MIYPGRTDPETLEALACREALALACDINARQVLVASDCSTVVQNLERGTMGVYAHVVQEITKARKSFDQMSFCHERRVHNKEAHRLARSVVLDDPGRQVWLWLVDPPEGLCIPVSVNV